MDTTNVSVDEAQTILNQKESHFFDFKSKRIQGKKLQVTIVAMANADGGEVLVGIEDPKPANPQDLSRWDGFTSYEEANSLIQTIFQDIQPNPSVLFEFYQIQNNEVKGLVLKCTIEKSPNVHYTSDRSAYVRKNAQNLQIIGEALVNLQLSKGMTSYEDQAIMGYQTDELVNEDELKRFLDVFSPRTEPLHYLKSQRLIKSENGNQTPIAAAILLYSENPSAIIPKKCAIKISRYETSEKIPQREHLKIQYTIEGPIKQQIDKSVECIQKIIESMKILGETGLEPPKYPIEAIKEIIVNAVIHRDYNVSDDILVTIFDNRIEVKSPGRLPGHITLKNILDERFARNSKIVRLINKYPNPPNKDIGEGLNTAFQKMKEMRLKDPNIEETEYAVIVILPHQTLAAPDEIVLDYLKKNPEITNSIGRNLSGISSENKMKKVFYNLRDRGIIEKVPGKKGPLTAWRMKK